LVRSHPSSLTTSVDVGKNYGGRSGEQGMSAHSARAATPTPSGVDGPAAVDVVGWRAERLRDAGFPPGLAERLARQRVDLHALLQLVDRGCPPHLAARILAPDDTAIGIR
jgi:hypothetical protein